MINYLAFHLFLLTIMESDSLEIPLKFRNSSHTRMTVTRTMDDGQAWRKYGQKVILNAKFPRFVHGPVRNCAEFHLGFSYREILALVPRSKVQRSISVLSVNCLWTNCGIFHLFRSYFRCTHKNDRSCKATKQVQMMEDGSGTYRTKYIGFHTCNRDPIRPPQLIAPNYGPKGNDYIILPEDDLKEETCKDHVDSRSDLTDNFSLGSSQDHSSFPRFELSPPRREDRGDISGMYMSGVDDDGSHSEMELWARGPVGFLGDFYFDGSNLS